MRSASEVDSRLKGISGLGEALSLHPTFSQNSVIRTSFFREAFWFLFQMCTPGREASEDFGDLFLTPGLAGDPWALGFVQALS